MQHDVAVLDSAKVIESRDEEIRTLREENTDLEDALKDTRFQIAEQLSELSFLRARVRVLEQREYNAMAANHQMNALMQQQQMLAAQNVQSAMPYQQALNQPSSVWHDCTCIPDRASALSRANSLGIPDRPESLMGLYHYLFGGR